MASTAAAGAIKHEADSRTVAVLEAHGRPGAVEDLQTTGAGSPRDLWHAFAAQSVMIAGLAELVQDQAQRITALEDAAKPAASAKKAAKKS